MIRVCSICIGITILVNSPGFFFLQASNSPSIVPAAGACRKVPHTCKVTFHMLQNWICPSILMANAELTSYNKNERRFGFSKNLPCPP